MSIKLTESRLRQIVREEALRLLENTEAAVTEAADPELEAHIADFQKHYPEFFRMGGVVRRDENGHVVAYPGGDQSMQLNRPFRPKLSTGGVLGQGLGRKY